MLSELGGDLKGSCDAEGRVDDVQWLLRMRGYSYILFGVRSSAVGDGMMPFDW
jgi:hypothetical protein